MCIYKNNIKQQYTTNKGHPFIYTEFFCIFSWDSKQTRQKEPNDFEALKVTKNRKRERSRDQLVVENMGEVFTLEKKPTKTGEKWCLLWEVPTRFFLEKIWKKGVFSTWNLNHPFFDKIIPKNLIVKSHTNG